MIKKLQTTDTLVYTFYLGGTFQCSIYKKEQFSSIFPGGIYLFKGNSRNTRLMCETCS